ncbi:glycoside hydrolase family 88 protein [Planctomycetota bacterium]
MELFIKDIVYGSSSRNNFGNALLALGILTNFRKSSNLEDLDVLNSYISKIIDKSDNFQEDLKTVDQCMIGYTLLGLYEINKNETLLNPIHQINKFILDFHIRTEGGLIPYRKHQPSILYIDTLGMICPFLARYGYKFNSKECQDIAFQQLYDFYKNAIDHKTGLPFHAYEETQEIGFGLRGWTRGIGWYCIGLIDTIAYLPDDSDQRKILIDYFEEIIESVETYQKENGCWSWEICNINSRDDTSGTAMIGYSIARACEIGVLEETYAIISQKALMGIIGYTSIDGKIWSSLAACGGIGDYPQLFGHAPWGQGPTLALCALLQDTEEDVE